MDSNCTRRTRSTQHRDKIEVREKVKVFRDTEQHYTGPFPVIRVDGKQTFVLNGEGEVRFSLYQVILATEFDTIVNGDSLSSTAHIALSSLHSTHRSSTKERKRDIPQVLFTVILHRSDPRLQCGKAEQASQKEIELLVRRGTWKLILE